MPRQRVGLVQIMLDRLKEAYFISVRKRLDVSQLGMKDLDIIFAKFPKQSINHQRHKAKPTSMDLKRIKDAWIEFCSDDIEEIFKEKYRGIREGWDLELKNGGILLEAVKTVVKEKEEENETLNDEYISEDIIKKAFVDLYSQNDASRFVNNSLEYFKQEIEYWKGRGKADPRVFVSLYTGMANITIEVYNQNAPSEAYKTMVGLEKLGKTAEVEGIKTIEQTAEVQAGEETELTV